MLKTPERYTPERAPKKALEKADKSKENLKTEIERLKEERFMYKHFIEGLEKNKFEPLKDKEIEK